MHQLVIYVLLARYVTIHFRNLATFNVILKIYMSHPPLAIAILFIV